MVIGITGLIGSGKSAAARYFGKYGAFVISADKIGRDVVEKNRPILKALKNTFGPEIFSKSGILRRRTLGELAFSSEKKKRQLNRIVHPPLLRELARQVSAAERQYKIVVVDAALLIDWKWYKKVDLMVLIHASYRNRVSRLVRSGYIEKEARMRTKSQLNYSELSRYADVIVINNSTFSALEKKVRNIIDGISERG